MMMRASAALLLVLSGTACIGQADIPALDWEPRSDWVSVREFGAVGDGAADDTSAIQSALDTITDGSAVYLPPGTYRVTETLTLVGPRIGALVVGHGRDTKLVWDGEAGGRVFMDDGVAYSRYVGLTFEGQGKASVGFFHHSDNRFETEVLHQHLAFRNFTEAAILADHEDKYALAETNFDNCLFEDCGCGVRFINFNDYNYTFDGCEFRRCGIGIDCSHGNFYARNTHFEGSTTVDIQSAPEHACSVRRCTSVGSAKFISHANSVSPISIQDCQVSGWTGDGGAISISSAPALVFDCVFTDPPSDASPVRIPRGGQRLIVSENRTESAGGVLPAQHNANVYVVPAGERTGSIASAKQTFLRDTADIPTALFDVKRDFGAVGDGAADDTAAIQAAIDAAREHGDGALAYLPTGEYIVSETLRITGSDYRVGGSGFVTRVRWRGEEGGTVFAIHDPDNVTLEHLAVGHHDGGPATNGIDIHQTGSDAASRMTYDGVFAYGMYQRQPERQGLRFSGLGENAVVVMRHVQGNLRFTDCARATIIGNTTFEGSIIVEGSDTRRTGFLGFMTRLATLVTHGLYLRDSHSIVMSDFYVEQANNGFVFEGTPDAPEGRATIGGAKLHFTVGEDEADKGTAMRVSNYAGQIFFGPEQLYVEPTAVTVVHEGTRPVDLFFLGSCFYRTHLALTKTDTATTYLIGNESVGFVEGDDVTPADVEAKDDYTPEALADVSLALDDLRRLGEVDLALNHGVR